MEAMRRYTRWVLVLFASVAVACNKGPAEDALRVADQAIAGAQPELETYAPGELAALTAGVRQARAQVDQGHYTEALKAARLVPARVRAALAVAAAEKQRRAATWNELAKGVPRLAQTIATRIAWLTEAQRLPRGMDEAGFVAVRTDLASVTSAWAEASAAFDRGDVATALRAGREVEAKAEALAATLGLVASSPPSPAAPTPSATPAALAP
jgi:hypothetical protein